MILLLICQGISQHLQVEPEAFGLPVEWTQNKQELVVQRNDLFLEDPQAPWPEVLEENRPGPSGKRSVLRKGLLWNAKIPR